MNRYLDIAPEVQQAVAEGRPVAVSYTHLDVYKRQQYTWPMFTSCCPGWVRFVKTQFPKYCLLYTSRCV